MKSMRPLKHLGLRALMAGSVGGAGYVAADEDRRAKAGQVVAAQGRIANLVGTASVMVVDYGVTLQLNKDVGATNEYARLSNALKKLQHDQEVFTIAQWKVKDDAARAEEWQQKIDETRKLIDKTAEDMGNLASPSSLSSAAETDVNPLASCHARNAARLRDMCARNRGCYIKLGQHLAMLDHILPQEYTDTLSTLLANTPRTSYSAVRRIIKEDLGAYPEELFSSFSPEPMASASLAQVHVAYTKEGKKVAVKVQHEGLREGSAGDMFAITVLVDLVSRLFEGFSYTWLSREMNVNLPLELDFENELRNIAKATSLLKKLIDSGDLAIPKAHANFSSKRVLCMDFEEGCYVTDVSKIPSGIVTGDVAALISRVFCEQMYRNGFCHCDPHEGNVLVRRHPFKPNKPQIVLLDHGLYRELKDSFRRDYCRLWRALVVGDEKEIKFRCERMHVGPAFTLLAAILTMRPWDDITSGDMGRLKNKGSKGESEMLKAYAKRYFKDIVALLGRVDSEMLLLLKTNDCLRHLDKRLGAPINTAQVVADITSSVIIREDLSDLFSSPFTTFSLAKLSEVLTNWIRVQLRLLAMRLYSWFLLF
jgi:aarF domain-containing kinase